MRFKGKKSVYDIFVEREDVIQQNIIKWADWQSYHGNKLSDYLHHSPNGGKRDIATAQKFKTMGTKAGFPDLFLFIPNGEYHGLFIELKTSKGKVSKKQQTMMDKLNAMGYLAVVCYGYHEAVNQIKSYLNQADG